MKSTQPSLEDVVEHVSAKVSGRKDPGLPYIGLEHLAQGNPFLLDTALSLEYVGVNSIFEPNDILFGKLRPNLRKCVQVNFKGYCSTDILVLRPRDGVVPSFAAKVLQRDDVFAEAIRTAEGTKMPRTSWEKIKTFPVFVPCEAEQRRIAEVLDAVDAAIQRTDTLINKLNWMKAGLLNDLLTRGLDRDGKLRDSVSNPEQFEDKKPYGLMPEGWDVQRLKTYATVTVGYVGPIEEYYCDADAGVLFLRTGNITGHGIDLQDVRYVTRTFHELTRKSALQGGDVIVSRVGYTGVAAVIPSSIREANCANVIIIRCTDFLAPQFLSLLFSSNSFAQQIQGFTAGSAQPVFNIKLVERLITPCPPIKEQHLIIKAAAEQDKFIRVEEATRDKLVQIKKGLMHDLLTGRVRVPVAKSEVVAV